MLEKVIQSQILQYLGYSGIKAFRMNAGMARIGQGRKQRMIKLAPAGFSDIFGVMKDGRALFIEVKAGKNKPTKLQELFLEEMREQGAIAFWANSVETVEKKLASSSFDN